MSNKLVKTVMSPITHLRNLASSQNVQTDKEELGEYSEGVKKRIAKLTRKMREAERQKEEAIAYAQSVNQPSTTKCVVSMINSAVNILTS